MAKKNSEIPPEPLDEGSPVPQKSSLKKWLILGALVFILLAAGGGAAVFFFPEYLPESLNFFGHKPAKGSPAQIGRAHV